MRRFFLVLMVAACLWPEGGPARAQATADQFNKLSLEALTTPAPGGNPGAGYGRRSAHRSFYHALSRSGGRGRSFRGGRDGGYRLAAHRTRAYRTRAPGYRAHRTLAGRAGGYDRRPASFPEGRRAGPARRSHSTARGRRRG